MTHNPRLPEDDLSCIERRTLSTAASYLVEAARRAAEAAVKVEVEKKAAKADVC